MRSIVRHLQESRIREVANAGLGRSDVLAFWFGESDEVTPEPIRRAAADSLIRGETFYAHNLGLPELRAAIAAKGLDELAAAAKDAKADLPFGEVDLLPVIPDPDKILCIGLNYRK